MPAAANMIRPPQFYDVRIEFLNGDMEGRVLTVRASSIGLDLAANYAAAIHDIPPPWPDLPTIEHHNVTLTMSKAVMAWSKSATPAVALGRKGRAAMTPAQAKASRRNGKKGGRPRKPKPSAS